MSLSNYQPGQELASIDFSSLIGGPLTAIVDAQSTAALSTVNFVKSIGFTPDTEDETTGEVTPGKPIYVNFKFPKLVEPYQPAIKGKIKEINIINPGKNYAVGDNLSVNDITITVTEIEGTDNKIKNIDFDRSITGISNATNVTETGIKTETEKAHFDIVTEDIKAEPAKFEEMRLQVPILTLMPIPFIRVEEGEIDFNAKITSMEFARVSSSLKFSSDVSVSNQNTNANLTGYYSVNVNKNVNTVKLKTSVSFKRNSIKGHKIDKTFHMGVKIKVGQEEMPEGMERLLGILEDAIVAQPTE